MAFNDYGVWTIIYRSLINSSLIFILLFFTLKWIPQFKFSKQSFDKLFGFGSKLLIINTLNTISNNLTSMLVGKFYGVTDAGYYSQSQRLTSITSSALLTVLHNVTYPVMSLIQDDEIRLLAVYKKILGMTVFIVLPIMIGLALIAEPFVLIFLTEKWLPIVPLVQGLCLVCAFHPINVITLNILNVTGRPELSLKLETLKFPICVGLLLLAIPFGLQAMVISQVIARAFCFCINTYYPGKFYSFGLLEQLKFMLPTMGATFFMVVVICLVDNTDPYVELSQSILVGGLAYIVSASVFKVKAYYDLLNILNSKFGRKPFHK